MSDGRGIGGSTRFAAVIGWPVEHSLSPAIHNAAFDEIGLDAIYIALPVHPDDVPAAIRGLKAVHCLGLSVTVPHKHAVASECDRLEGAAKATGAVNCVSFEESGVVGHNTDAAGFVAGMREELGLEPAGMRAVLLGAGGAAHAVAYGLEEAGATVSVVARTPARVPWAAAERFEQATLERLFEGADLIIDATPTGLSEGGIDALPCQPPLDRLGEGAVVASLVYHREPELLSRARERGLRTIDGASMLVHQGALAFRIWTGTEAPVERMRLAFRGASGSR